MKLSIKSCATLLLWCAAFAQDEGVVRLKVETRVVQVAVAVKDAQGRPVRDLRKEDFTVLDEGKHREIALFSAGTETAEAPVRPPSLPPNVLAAKGVREPLADGPDADGPCSESQPR